MYREAARLSKKRRLPIVLRLSTHICHAKTKVFFGPYTPIKEHHKALFAVKNGPYIPLTEKALAMKRLTLEKPSKNWTRLPSTRNNPLITEWMTIIILIGGLSPPVCPIIRQPGGYCTGPGRPDARTVIPEKQGLFRIKKTG